MLDSLRILYELHIKSLYFRVQHIIVIRIPFTTHYIHGIDTERDLRVPPK